MEDFKEYYKDDKLALNFDKNKDGYWLSIGKRSYFIDSRSYEDIKNSKGLRLFDKLENYDFMITNNLQREKILPSKLEYMFSEVNGKLEKEFEEFKKQDNL